MTGDRDRAVCLRLVRDGPTTRLVVAGRLGPLGAELLRRDLHLLVSSGERRVVVDLSEAQFDGPCGLAVLIVSRRVMRALGGTVELAGFAEPDPTAAENAALSVACRVGVLRLG